MNIIYHLLSIIIKSCYLLFLVSNIHYELLEICYYYYESLFIYNLFLKPFFLSFTLLFVICGLNTSLYYMASQFPI